MKTIMISYWYQEYANLPYKEGETFLYSPNKVKKILNDLTRKKYRGDVTILGDTTLIYISKNR